MRRIKNTEPPKMIDRKREKELAKKKQWQRWWKAFKKASDQEQIKMLTPK